MKVNQALSLVLSERRRQLGRSIREAERISGVSRSTLSLLESGKRGCTIELLYRLVSGYSLTPRGLLGRVEQKTR